MVILFFGSYGSLGIFNLEGATVEIIDHITEAVPSKYRDCNQVIRWQMPRHEGRVLYTILDSEQDKKAWMKAFDTFDTVRRAFIFVRKSGSMSGEKFVEESCVVTIFDMTFTFSPVDSNQL